MAKTENELDFFKSYSEAEEALEIQTGSQFLGLKLQTLTTGSIALDDALSSGGYPFGRLIQLYGPTGSGKSLLTLIAIKNAQELDPSAKQVLIDAEGTFSASWAATLGVNLSKLIIIQNDMAVNGRRCFEMLLGVPKEDQKTHVLKGKSKEGLLDKIRNKALNINLIILDSLGAIIPPIEDTAVVGKNNMSPLARFLSTTFKKLSLEVKKANVPFLIVNHKKDNMDPYGADHTYSGGNAYSHFLSAIIYVQAVRKNDEAILDDNENRIGHPLKVTIEKSKFGPWPKVCTFRVNFGIGVVDQHEEVAFLALQYDIVKKISSVTLEYNGTKWVGKEKFIDHLKDNPELIKALKEEIVIARQNYWENLKKNNSDIGAKSEEDEFFKSLEAAEPTASENAEVEDQPKKKKGK